MHPGKAMMQSESFPTKMWESWQAVQKHDYVIGDFGWAGWDYLGEASAGSTFLVKRGEPDPPISTPIRLDYPWFGSACGDLDLLGFPKPQWYYKRVLWNDSQLEMAVERPVPDGMEQRALYWSYYDELQSWTWNVPPGFMMRVRIYASVDRIRLQLNGRQVAEAEFEASDRNVRTFDIPYQPGELRAVGFIGGREVASRVFRTAGAPARLRLKPFEPKLPAGRSSIAHLIVEVLDREDQLVPDAVVDVAVEARGAGTVFGMANANLKNMDSFRTSGRFTYHGRALAVVRSTGIAGSARVWAHADGLTSGNCTLRFS